MMNLFCATVLRFSFIMFGLFGLSYSILVSSFHFISSFVMPQMCGSCGHKKAKWDNHTSCLSCSKCSVDNKCDICSIWSLDTWYSAIRRLSYLSRMPKKQDITLPQSSKFSKKANVYDIFSHPGSGAEEVPLVQTEDVVSNIRSDNILQAGLTTLCQMSGLKIAILGLFSQMNLKISLHKAINYQTILLPVMRRFLVIPNQCIKMLIKILERKIPVP